VEERGLTYSNKTDSTKQFYPSGPLIRIEAPADDETSETMEAEQQMNERRLIPLAGAKT
jgi:hypothetical protein